MNTNKPKGIKMGKYHINPETGNPGLCRAQQQCRFGGSSAHYGSEQEAREAFEVTQEALQSFKKEDPAESKTVFLLKSGDKHDGDVTIIKSFEELKEALEDDFSDDFTEAQQKEWDKATTTEELNKVLEGTSAAQWGIWVESQTVTTKSDEPTYTYTNEPTYTIITPEDTAANPISESDLKDYLMEELETAGFTRNLSDEEIYAYIKKINEAKNIDDFNDLLEELTPFGEYIN
jgi:hypothetical protein